MINWLRSHLLWWLLAVVAGVMLYVALRYELPAAWPWDQASSVVVSEVSGKPPEATQASPLMVSKVPAHSSVESTRAETPARVETEAEAVEIPTATETVSATVTAKSTAVTETLVPSDAPSAPGSAPVFTYEIVNSYPHDPRAFTQGLVYHNGFLYEGTGLRGASTLRKVELATGQVLQHKQLPTQYFGEGIALFEGQIYQLTWRSNVGFVYNVDTFEQQRVLRYETEGWGLTHDGTLLIMSDGSSVLTVRDPETFKAVRRVTVKEGNTEIVRLNELEYVEGEVFANVWQTNRIVRIDPETGAVTGWIDLTGLLSNEDRTGREDVLNGIAYDPETRRLFVTGKLWPKLFEIRLVEK